MTNPADKHVHRHAVAVRWGDCDPAGIVYYPRFFDWFHQAMETWFSEVLAMPYHEVIGRRRIGFPSVHTEADFKVPSEFGEQLEIEMRVSAMGRTSVTFDYLVRGARAGEIRATGRSVCVVMDLDPESDGFRRPVVIPDDLRHAIERFRGRRTAKHQTVSGTKQSRR